MSDLCVSFEKARSSWFRDQFCGSEMRRSFRNLLLVILLCSTLPSRIHADSQDRGVGNVDVSDGRDSRPNLEQSTSESARPAPRDTLVFSNGDFLFGTLENIEPNSTIRWRHPDAIDAIEFSPRSVSGIEFGFRAQPPFQRKRACRIRLVGQDEVEGNLLSCDTQEVVLESSYAGRMVLPRSTVRVITPKPNEPPPVYEGPMGPEGWTFGKVRGGIPNAGDWSYRSGAFYATKSASVARDVNLPDVASVQFDLAWKGMLYIAIALYTDYLEPVSLQSKESEPKFGGFYSLQLSSYTVNLLPITQRDPIRYLGQTSVPAFSKKNKAHVDVRINKAKRTTTLMVDGAVVKQWIDTEGFVGEGTGLRLVHQGQGAVKLNNLRVSKWDGQFEEKLSNSPNRSHDLVTLRNGDKILGKIEEIREDQVRFTSANGKELEIPFERVKVFELAGQDISQSTEIGTNAKATFRNGGIIRFQLERWTPQGVVAISSSFGKAVFHPSAFDRMDVDFTSEAKPRD